MARKQSLAGTNRALVSAMLFVSFCFASMNFVILHGLREGDVDVSQTKEFSGPAEDLSAVVNFNSAEDIENPDPPTKLCKNHSSSSSSNSYLSQTDARRIIKDFVQERTEQNGRPRFVPVLNSLVEAASELGVSLMTFQLGGMDGKTGDPMYRMTQFQNSLEYWEPVVVEPVPANFQKLVGTYRAHQENKGLKCPHLLHQLISYDNEHQQRDKKCHFCHFDPSKADAEECKDFPEYLKHETGSMECDNEHNVLKSKCFVEETYTCGTIAEALRSEGLSSENVAVLQIDVEGFEQQMISGYLDEIPPEHYPAVINFESKVIKARGELNDVFDKLRQKGYGIHQKRVDTLALWGAQGLLLDNL